MVLEAFSSRARFICTTVVQIGVANASAPVAAPAVPSAAAPGAMPVAAPANIQ